MNDLPLKNLPRKLPESLSLEITPERNFSCPYCYCLWHEFPQLGSPALTAKEWSRVICYAAEQGVKDLLFTGGEVLLFPEIKTLLKCARQELPSAEISLFTNGSLMTEEFFLFCKKNKIRLSTSLQGLQTYGKMTGTDRTFHSLLELIAYAHQKKWKLSVSMTVTQANRHEICDMFAAAALSGAETIMLGAMMPAGRGKANLELTLSRNEWESVKKLIQETADYGVPYSFCDEMICECRRYPEDIIKHFGNSDKKPCPAGKKFGVIGPNGTYRKCLHYWSGRK